jgi:hypothetical protein
MWPDTECKHINVHGGGILMYLKYIRSLQSDAVI